MTGPRLHVCNLAVALGLSVVACAEARAPRKPHPQYDAVVQPGNKDADTLFITKPNGLTTKVRLHSDDAPECSHGTKEIDQPYGPEARDLTAKLVGGKKVHIEEVGKYPYRPFDPIVEVTLPDGTNLSDELLKAGAAWLDTRYDHSPKRLAEMNAAKAAKIGLWGNPTPIPPSVWRKQGMAKQPQ